MRHENVTITGCAGSLGQFVRTPPLRRAGLLTTEDIRSTQQRGVCIAEGTGRELAASAAELALTSHVRRTGTPAEIGMHLHTSMTDSTTVGTVAGEVRAQVPIAGGEVEHDLSTTDGLLAWEAAAQFITAGRDNATALVTTGDQWGRIRMRSAAEHDVLVGDAGTATVFSRQPGFARLLSTAIHIDDSLSGLERGAQPVTAPSTVDDTRPGVDAPVDLRARKAAWLEANGGRAEIVRRMRAGALHAVTEALADADIDSDSFRADVQRDHRRGGGGVRWVIVPFLGRAAAQQWLVTLAVPMDRTLIELGLQTGSLGASDVGVGLHHLRRTRQLAPGDRILLASSGPGMTWTAAVLKIEVAE